ncbi:mRNA-capping enzyme-like protein isoform X2, partial [Tanacetum coccineum]
MPSEAVEQGMDANVPDEIDGAKGEQKKGIKHCKRWYWNDSELENKRYITQLYEMHLLLNPSQREELENELTNREELAVLQVEFADMEGYSPWLPLPPIIKGCKFSSSTPGAEDHITHCSSDRACSSFDVVDYEETSIQKKEAHVIKRLIHVDSDGTRMQRKKLSQCKALWDDQQLLKSGASRGIEVTFPRLVGLPSIRGCTQFYYTFKSSLKEACNDKIDIDKRYSPQQAILQQRGLGRELGLVIDLTNTHRYYQELDLTTREVSIKYVKIRCAGKDSVPDNESVEKFIQVVTQFSSQYALNSNKYVLVHCTHGHNRTGFMIVHFLIQSESISFTEKQDFVDDLCNFFGEQLPKTFVCPQTPEWKRSPDRDDDVASGLQDNGFQASQMPNVVEKGDTINVVGAGEMANAVGEDEMENVTVPSEMTNDDVLGDTVPLNKMEPNRKFCNDILKLNFKPDSRGRREALFLGSHHVSLSG